MEYDNLEQNPDQPGRRHCQKDAVTHDWEEVVDRAGALLLAVGAVWPSYIEAMKDMIRPYGPYIVAALGAALLHAGPETTGKRLNTPLQSPSDNCSNCRLIAGLRYG